MAVSKEVSGLRLIGDAASGGGGGGCRSGRVDDTADDSGEYSGMYCDGLRESDCTWRRGGARDGGVITTEPGVLTTLVFTAASTGVREKLVSVALSTGRRCGTDREGVVVSV